MRTFKMLAVGGVAVSLMAITAAPASAFPNDPKNGPGPTKIVNRWDTAWTGTVVLREGNSKYGRQHIAMGGSKGNKHNHELSNAAKSLWIKAIENLQGGSQTSAGYPNGQVSSYKYKLSNGSTRTMCVITDYNDLKHGGKNYGSKGIVTAYWTTGWRNAKDCGKP